MIKTEISTLNFNCTVHVSKIKYTLEIPCPTDIRQVFHRVSQNTL